MDYVFMTDSDSDLPYKLKSRYDIPVVSMPYALDGKEYFDDLGQSLDYKSYYDRIRHGAIPVTSALNEQDYLNYFEPILQKTDLLFLAFSSQLSRTILSVYSARDKLLVRYPKRKFIVVDTLSISAPMTLLILKAHELYRAGRSMEEVADWVNQNKLRAQYWITVDDLKYLCRGGRVSSVSATVGSMFDIKPVVIVSREGKLLPSTKIRGRKKAISYLAEQAQANLLDPPEGPCVISHADASEDAEALAGLIRKNVPGLEIIIAPAGPVIGAHCGPGALAVSVLGKERTV